MGRQWDYVITRHLKHHLNEFNFGINFFKKKIDLFKLITAIYFK